MVHDRPGLGARPLVYHVATLDDHISSGLFNQPRPDAGRPSRPKSPVSHRLILPKSGTYERKKKFSILGHAHRLLPPSPLPPFPLLPPASCPPFQSRLDARRENFSYTSLIECAQNLGCDCLKDDPTWYRVSQKRVPRWWSAV